LSHLDYDPPKRLLAAKLEPWDAQRLADLKAMLPSPNRYNGARKHWEFPVAYAAWAVQVLVPLGYEPTPTFVAEFAALLAPVAPAPPIPPPAVSSVSELLDEIRRALRDRFDAPRWISGTLIGFERTKGKRYLACELAEIPDGAQVQRASLAVYVPEAAAARIRKRFEKAGLTLEERMPVLLRGRVVLASFGNKVQLEVDDADPAYTLGKQAETLDRLYRRLVEEGLASRNPAIPLPTLATRLGIVSSPNAQGFQDLVAVLGQAGGAFEVELAEAAMQGPQTAREVGRAIAILAARRPDAILIVRGGGAKGDLNWFNDEALARAVCLCPVPVLVGIGHTSDETILDRVARPHPTPTALGTFLVKQVETALEAVESGTRRALAGLLHRLALEQERTRAGAFALRSAAFARTGGERTTLARHAERIAAQPRLLRQRIEALSVMQARLVPLPARRVDDALFRVDSVVLRMGQVCWRARSAGEAFDALASRLPGLALREFPGSFRSIEQFAERLARVGRQPAVAEAARLGDLAHRLAAVDPAKQFARGFAMIKRPGGRRVRSASELRPGDPLEIVLPDGIARARIEEIHHAGGQDEPGRA